jgi:prephenate dehydrogenase
MTVHIAVIGLNREGISAAMALSAKHNQIQCSGWDPDPDKRAAAEEFKIFQPVCKDIKAAINGVSMILITLPPEDFQQSLQEIKSYGTSETVLVNLSLLHALPAKWIEEELGKTAHYFSMLPALSAAYLQEPGGEPKADLFTGGVMYISTSARADAVLLDLAVDLAVLLGGLPVFADANEVDGLSAANLLLPELTGAALMAALSGQPSWREGMKMAGSALAGSTAPLVDGSTGQTAQIALANSENTLRLLDSLSFSLRNIKQAIQAQDSAALGDLLAESREARQDWLLERRRPGAAKELADSLPSEKQALERFLNLGK